MLNINIRVYPDGVLVVQGYEVPFLTRIQLLSTVDRDLYLCRISLAAVSIHLVVDAVLRIDTWLKSDSTALDVRILSQ